MCNFGGNDTTKQTSNQTYKPAGAGTMQDVINRANTTSQLPYTPITQQVAGLNPFQQQALENMSGATTLAQNSPYMQSAAAHFENASNPLTAANVNQYMNPFAANVLANMQEVFGQQQRDETGRLTGAAGGIGADRIAVGKGELARQQGLAAGQTLAGIYQNALQAAQNQQGIEQASAYGLGNLSQAELSAILSANQGLFGLGNIQQQTEQAGYNAAFNQQMAQAAYPFQTAQWYAGLALPAAGGMGGKTRGVQTVDPPDPNALSQIAGLGLTALGAFAKDGGRIEGYAQGGSPFSSKMYDTDKSYVPDSTQLGQVLTGGKPMGDMQPLSYLSAPNTGMGGVGGKGSNIQAGKGLGNIYDSLFTSPDATGGGWDATVSPSGTGGWGNFLSNLMPFKRGGSIEDSEPYKILSSIARGSGGEVDEPNRILKVDKGEEPSTMAKLGDLFFSNRRSNNWAVLDDEIAGRVSDHPKGYATGGSPYFFPPSLGGAPTLLDEEPKLRNRFPELEPKQYYSKPAFDELGGVEQFIGSSGRSRLSSPTYGKETIATKTPLVNPVTDVPWQAPTKPKGPAGFTIDEPAAPVPGLAGTTGAPGGIANDPWVATEPPKEDYSVYTPEDGYTKSPWGGTIYAKGGPNGELPGGAPQGDAEVPDEASFFQEGRDGPVSPNATSRTLAADAGEPQFKGAGRGRWSNAYADVPPYERPKLFGKELSNMNIALMAAGLGMLGGGSPYFGVNVGQGGLKGIEALQEFQKLDANRQAQYLQNMLEAGRLDVAEQQAGFTRYDKMIDNERQLAVYYDGIGDTEKANAHQQRADELTRQYYGGGDSEPVVPGSVPEGAEAVSPEAVNAPATEYSIPEPPQVDFSHQSKDARAINKSIGLETLKKANEQYDASQSQSMLLAQTRHALMQMPKDGLLTAGPGAQFRNEFARFVNTAYAIGGGQPPIDPTTVGSIEELKKLTTRMGFDLARTLGTREAMQVIQQAVGAVPGAENTPMGARRIMAGIQAGFIRDRDWYEYLDAYAKKNGGDISGAKVAFNKARPTSYYIKMSDEIVAAQTLVADGKMSQEEAVGHLIEQGINPDDVF